MRSLLSIRGKLEARQRLSYWVDQVSFIIPLRTEELDSFGAQIPAVKTESA